ncbi:MAG TPA: LuxR family transcriptional regulator, partial [Cyanobacteria bacterium UBA11166]|nr:LuxR family transcriptional regulator [Cyanobacteria bacterium UBA11166]
MVLKASVQGLEIVDKARKKKGWTKTVTVAWWQDALTTQATLRRFWRGIPIQSESFMNICHAVGISNWQDIVDKITDEEGESLEISYQEDWGEAPQLSTFYGRTEELTQLQEWIVNDRCRLVAFLGMGGIGKTALSVMLADKIQHDFDYLIWRSLRYSTSAKDLLTQIVQFLSNRKIEDLPTEFNSAVSLLIEYLKSHRCLVIFDGAEAIISQGETSEFYKEGYENWGELIKRLGQQRHKSTVIFTSREQF